MSAEIPDVAGLERAIEPLVKRLDRAHFSRRRPSHDEMFQALTILGEIGIPVAVGLIVDGVRMTGALGRPEAFAAVVADAAGTVLGVTNWSAEDIENVTKRFTEQVEARRSALADARLVASRYQPGVGIDDIEAADVRDYYFALNEESTIALYQVQIFHEGYGAPTEVEYARVRTASISAWWPLEAQVGSSVTYGPPT
jgi:hypothetical protein